VSRAAAERAQERVRVVVRETFAMVSELSGAGFAQRHIEDIATRVAMKLAGQAIDLDEDSRMLLRHLRDDVGEAEKRALRGGEYPDAQLAAAQLELLDRLIGDRP
jgi:hypothetical protein